MACYSPMITFTALHDYFVQRICRPLTFKPTAATAAALRQHEILGRQRPAGFELLADRSSWCQPSEDETFRFHGYASDPHFATYTQLPGEPEGPLYYRIRRAGTDAPITEKDQVPDSGDAPSGHGKADERGQNPFIVVDVVLAPARSPGAVAIAPPAAVAVHDCVIELRARALYWKYFFFGDFASKDIELKDVQGEASVTFERYGGAATSVGTAFQSTAPIALHESPAQRIQLREAGFPDRFLIKRLPNAGPWQLGKSKDRNGVEVVVAEIYVNQ